MFVPSVAERLRQPLAWVIAALLVLSSVAALLAEPGPSSPDAMRATDGMTDESVTTDPALRGVDIVDTAPADDAGDPSDVSADPMSHGSTSPGGSSAVPAPGIYRYHVQTTDAEGTSTVQDEIREIELISGDRSAGTIEVSARLAGESQVSVIDWSPAGAFVRSTRIDSSASQGHDCTWEPAFPDLGALEDGASWTLDSTCRAPVGGVATTFRITGEGWVVGQATVTFGGEELRVWQIRRDRTTTIEADLQGSTRRQQAREDGTLFFDPVRGVVIRSDVTLTLDGPRSGVTRRISVLQPG